MSRRLMKSLVISLGVTMPWPMAQVTVLRYVSSMESSISDL